ncbi:MAG TPA: Gfo/Idh/MocA family oxidoreductase, partial [Spirochaetia bacterium]|nr:Gfo/Idh/MocA family oxidoreductase [Spirochaetia bacterium]
MKRYALVGTGNRGINAYFVPLLRDFVGSAELCGICDSNLSRARAAREIARERLDECGGTGAEVAASVPLFDDFETMMESVRPEAVIVCSADSTHAEYVVSCLKRNVEVFCEKPLCITAEQAREIETTSEASRASGWATHNMRFEPVPETIAFEIRRGTIGKVLHIEFSELLDRAHGADYFRRWHR